MLVKFHGDIFDCQHYYWKDENTFMLQLDGIGEIRCEDCRPVEVEITEDGVNFRCRMNKQNTLIRREHD